MIQEKLPQPERSTDFCYEASQWIYELYSDKGYEVIFSTVHGSYLYGTAHSKSDVDFYVVVKEGEGKQKKYEDNSDVILIDLEHFLTKVKEGTHQSVEALYSPYAVWNDESYYTPMIKRLHPSHASFIKKCLSASTSLMERVESGGEKDVIKMTQHAKRLEESAISMLEGKYSPVYQKFQ